MADQVPVQAPQESTAPQSAPVVQADLGVNSGLIDNRPLQAPLPPVNVPDFNTGNPFGNQQGTEGGVKTIAQLFNSMKTPSDEKHYLNPEYTPQPLTKRYENWNPYIDNEEIAAKNQPWYDKWANAFVKTGAIAVGTFAQGLMTVPDTMNAIKSGNFSGEYQSDFENGVDTWLKNLEDEFPNYYSKWEQAHPFLSALPFSGGGANFWSDKVLKNLGFTVGAIGSAIAQDTIVGAITEGIGEIPLIGQQLGKAALWFNKIFSTETKLGEALGATKPGLLSTIMNTAEAVPASRQAMFDLPKLAQMASLKKVTDAGRYAINLYGAARTEAGVEARDGFNTVKQDLIDQFKLQNQRDPTQEEVSDIEKYATAGANVRFGANMALLTLSDAIQFDNILKPFSAARKGITGSLQKALETQGAEIGLKEGTVDTFEKKVASTTGGKIWNAIKPQIPNILSEGIYEEGGQYAAQVATQNYYERKYYAEKKEGQLGTDKEAWSPSDIINIMHSTAQGLGGEFGTTEGWENILLGSLTAILTGGFEHWHDKIKGTSEKSTDATLSLLNNNSVVGLLQNMYGNTAKSAGHAQAMQDAVKKNDLFAFKNEQSQLFTNFILSHLQGNRFDVAMEKLNIAKDLPQAEFEKAFGIENSTGNKRTVSQYITELQEKAGEIKNNYDAINQVFENPYTFNRKVKDEAGLFQNDKHTKFEEWKYTLLQHNSDIDDTNRRRVQIADRVQAVHPSINRTLVEQLTHPKYLNSLGRDYNKQADELQKSIDQKLVTPEDRKETEAKINALKDRASAIEDYLKNPDDDKYLALFDNLLHFEVNLNEVSPENPIEIKKQLLPQLIRDGVDSNRLQARKEIARKAYDVLTSEKGFNKWFSALDKREGVSASIAENTPLAPVDVDTDNLKIPVKTADGKTVTFKEGEQSTLNFGTKDNPNVQTVTYQGTDNQGNLQFANQQGTILTAAPTQVNSVEDEQKDDEDAFKKQMTLVGTGSPINSTEVPDNGDMKKDLSKGPISTTDPRFEDKSAFNNFHQRHQTFLFNLGSTDPKKFDQEVKPNIRILPVTATIAKELGFPDEFTQAQDGQEPVIRAVYVVGGKDGIYALDEKGKIVQKLDGRQADPSKIIFTTLPDTSLKYQGQDRYTNKQGLDPAKVQAWQKAFRESLLRNSLQQMPVFKFNVSRGIPNIINQDSRNSVVQVGLISREDLKKAVITIPTQGDVAIAPLLNDAGEGIAADSTGVKMPVGVPLLNWGGNLIYLNNRKLTEQEASNSYDLIKELAKRARENKVKGEDTLDQTILKYLSRILYFSTPQEGKTATDQQIWLDKSGIHFGPSFSVPFFVNTIEANEAKIKEFLSNSYHNVNNYELSRVNKEKLQDLQFNELAMVKGKLTSVETHPTYSHYLLDSKNPPLATNIAKPVGNEIPIKQKYSVLQVSSFNTKALEVDKAQPKPPVPAVAVKAQVPVEAKKVTPSAKRTEVEDKIVQPDGRILKYAQVLDENDNIVDIRIIGGVDIEGKDVVIPEDKKGGLRNMLLQRAGIVSETPAITATPVVKKEEDEVDKFNKLMGEPETKPPVKKSGLGGRTNKPTDSQYRAALVIPGSYKVGNVEQEFEQAKEWLPDYVQFKMMKDLIHMTGGGKAWGAMKDAAIYVYQNAEIGTTYHEAFELVWQNFLDGAKQLSLYNEFRGREGTFTTYTGEKKTFAQADFKEAKEQIAEEFRDYVLNNSKVNLPVKQKNWFARLVDFIKRIFLGNQQDINQLFKNITEEYYKNYPASQKNINSIEYRNIKASEALIQDVLQGMTADLFAREFEKDSAIVTQLEENPKQAVATVYGRLFNSMQHFFTNDSMDATDTLKAIYDVKFDEAENEAEQAQIEQEYNGIQNQWEFIKANWDEFVGEHMQYLRVFKVEFSVDDNGEIKMDSTSRRELENYEQMTGQSEYARDIMTINAKNAASEKVKLLFATIADREFIKRITGDTLSTLGQSVEDKTRIKRENSQVRMPKLASYSKTFNYVLHNVTNINGIYDIYKKLVVMSNNTRIKTNAIIDALVRRLNFSSGFKGKNIDQAKLILSVENTLNKQKPDFVRQFVDDNGNVYFKTSIVNSRVDQTVDDWIAGMKSGQAVKVTKDGNFVFDERIKDVKHPVAFLNGIGIPVDVIDYNNLTPLDKTKFDGEVNALRSVIEGNIGKPMPIFTSKQIGIDSRLINLASIYVDKMVGDDTDSMHFNLDGELTSNFVLPNFASTIQNDANNSKTRDEFIAKNPHFNDIFHADSILLNEILFDRETGRFIAPVSIAVVEGRESADTDNKSASSLTEAERYIYEINNNLQGIFYTLLPADAKTEWAIYTGQYIKASEYFDDITGENARAKFYNIMWSNLKTEIALAQDFKTNTNRQNITELNKIYEGRKKGESLRFFADILPSDKVNDIHKQAIDGDSTLEDVLNPEDFQEIMKNWVADKAAKSFKYLSDNKIFGISNQGNLKLNGLLTDFLGKHIGAKRQYYTEAEALNLLMFREMNYAINNIEMHKFFFGDPAQYSDEMKRIKSFLSGREWSHVDYLGTAEGFNQWANGELNRVASVPLEEGDPGYHTFTNELKTLTLHDIIVESSSLEMLKKELGKDAKPYEEMNEADAQTWQSLPSYREALLKAGGRWTQKMEDQFQYEMAYERNEKYKAGTYEYSSESLRSADKKILDKGSDPEAFFYVMKPIHSGVQAKENTAIVSLDKTSSAPIYYRMAEERGLMDMYNSMQKNGDHYYRVVSAHKVGIQTDSTVSLYNEDGSINVEGINKAKREFIPFKYYGIQVDTSSRKESQTEGSQLRKQAVGDLLDDGVPIDFVEGAKSNKKTAKQAWDKLSEEDKRTVSPIYNLVQQHEEDLTALSNKRYENLLNKLGVTEVEDGFEYKDVKKVSDFLLNEITRRELPNNLRDAIEPDPENPKQFKVPPEALTNYQQVRAILWSTVEKNIIRPKVSGGMKTQLAATGWEKSHRIVKSFINGKAVLSSSELKFYAKGEDGKTAKCEVYLPYWFGSRVRNTLEKNGKEFKSDKEFRDHILNYLNETEEGKKLLSGIGFRIPTQRDNSIESFIVKDFLPEQMGDTIVLPSEVTAKAGSDFDIDKMNTYLRNFFINDKGYPEAVPFENVNSNDTQELTDYYEKYMLEARRNYEKWQRELGGKNLVNKIFQVQEEDKEPEYVPSLEEYLHQSKGKTAYELNSLEALENKYFDTLEQIYALPEKFKGLISPNDASDLKKIAQKIAKMRDPNYSESKQPYGRVLDSLWMMQERHKYLVGKKGVGIAAVAQTNLNVNQNAEVYLKVPRNVAIRLPHNKVQVGDKTYVSLGSIRNQSGQNISAVNAAFIDGYVDIAKGAWIIDMGANDTLASKFLLMTKWGTDPYDVALFMNQPAIRMYTNEQAIRKSVGQINKDLRQMNSVQLYNYVSSQIKPGQGKAVLRKNKPAEYTREQMEEMITKFGRGEELTKDEAKRQMQMLDDYQEYDKLSWDMFRFFQGYNWDTARTNDPNLTRKKMISERKAKNGPISSIDKVLKGFIGAVRDNVVKVDGALRGLFAVQTGQAGKMLDAISEDFAERRGVTQEDYRKSMLKAELSMMDYIMQTGTMTNGRTMNQLIDQVLISNFSAARYLKAIQDSGDVNLVNNPIVKNLRANIDKREGYPSSIELIEKDNDAYTSNIWTDAFRELSDSQVVISIDDNKANDRSVAQIYRMMVLASVLQSGTKRSSISFTHLLPNEHYAALVKDSVKDIKADTDNFYDNNILYRTNWEDNTIVPVVPPTSQDDFFEGQTITRKVYPGFNSNTFNQHLKDQGVESIPKVLRLDEFTWKDKKVVKTVEYKRDPKTKQITDRTIRLFQRVDTWESDKGSVPLVAKRREIQEGDFQESNVSYVVFKEINKWGDGNRVQEYYDGQIQSKLKTNPLVTELNEDLVTFAIMNSGYNVNTDDMMLGQIAQNFENQDAVQGGEIDTEPTDSGYDNITLPEENNSPKTEEDDVLKDKDNGCKK